MVTECGGADRSECSGTTQLELEQNAKKEVLWLAKNEELKCKAGNKNHCSNAENHPVETATFIIGSMVTMGLVDPVSIGAAMDALDALGLQATAVCLSTPICAILIGAGGAEATNSQAGTSLWPAPWNGRVVLGGITYSIHALERMMPVGFGERGVPSSVVQNAIAFGERTTGDFPYVVEIVYENVTVIFNTLTNTVITVIKTGQ
jgi:hypothetical protein